MSGRAATTNVIPGRSGISVGNPQTALPGGWVWAPLSLLALLGTGHTPSRGHPEYWDGDVPWLGIRDAGAHHGGLIFDTQQHITKLGLQNSSARLLPRNTICLSRTASVGYVVKMGREMATSQDFFTWSCGTWLDADFLMKALIAEGDHIRSFGEGSTHTTIYFPELKAFHIALAPLPEQSRIVKKIDSLSAKSGRARDNLDHVPPLVEKYKQVILAAAFRGELTSEWRIKNAEAQWPWTEVSLSEIATIGTGSTPKRGSTRYYSGGKTPWVTSGAVNEPVILSADEYITDAALRETNCKIFPAGTLLMAMYGEGQTRGRVAVLGIDAATNQALAAIQITPDSPAVRDFVLWHLRSGYLQLREQAAGGVQPNLNLGIIKAWRLPLPSRQEQYEIVRRVAKAFDWIERLASEAASARKLLDYLDQAILAKAFRGELVPQDPNDEPADLLLERIKAERSSNEHASKESKTTTQARPKTLSSPKSKPNSSAKRSVAKGRRKT